MFDLSDIPFYQIILMLFYVFLRLYWPWVATAAFVLILWRIKLPRRKKLHIAVIAICLYVFGKTVYSFFPGYVPGCKVNANNGVYKMPDYTIINQKGGKFFPPYNVTLKEPIRKIFPVPVRNSVGTIDFDNAITVLKFRGDTTPEYDIVAKNFLREVNGDYIFGFSPVFHQETIMYTQTRWAVVANIKTGNVRKPILTMSLDDIIGGIEPLDASDNIFVINKLIPDTRWSRQMLSVMKYDNGKFIGSGEIDAGGTFPFKQPWIVHDRKIITYDSAANKLLCHDADLKSSTHPFVEIFNRNSGNFRKLKEMIIHPTLPFGLVVEIGKDLDWEKIFAMPLNDETDKIKRALYKQQEIHALYLLRWDITDTNKQYIPLHTDTLSFLPPLAVKQYGRFSFSPDGKWLVFGHEDIGRDQYGNLGPGGEWQPFFIALPVDEKKPFFFGEPIFMGRTLIKDNDVTATAWTTDPTSFVAADGACLYKWDLGKLHEARTVTTPDTLFPLE
jgi:hypothetical protein